MVIIPKTTFEPYQRHNFCVQYIHLKVTIYDQQKGKHYSDKAASTRNIIIFKSGDFITTFLFF